MPDTPGTSRTHSFAAVFGIYLLINLGLEFGETLVSPFAATLGAAPVLIGIAASGFTYGSVILRLVSGPVIDALERRRILAAAVGLIAIAFVGDALATSLPVLIFFRILQGAGQAFTAPLCLTIAADVTPRRHLAHGMGTLAVARGIAGMIGPLLSLKICEAAGYRTSFFLACLIECLCLLALMRLPSTRAPRTGKIRLRLSHCFAREALVPALLQFLFMMAWSCVFAYLVVFGRQQGLDSNVGLFDAVYGASVFLAAPLGGRLVDRFGTVMLYPQLALMCVSLWLISRTTTLPLLVAAAVTGAFGYGAAGPVVRSMALGMVPARRRGAAGSTLYFFSDIGQMLGPAVAGLLAAHFGYAAMFRIAPVWVVAAAMVLFVWRRLPHHRACAASPQDSDHRRIRPQRLKDE